MTPETSFERPVTGALPFECLWNASPRIGDKEADPPALSLQSKLDAAVVWAVLDGIEEQVEDDLLQPIDFSFHHAAAVAGCGKWLAIQALTEVNILASAGGSNVVGAGVDKAHEIHGNQDQIRVTRSQPL